MIKHIICPCWWYSDKICIGFAYFTFIDRIIKWFLCSNIRISSITTEFTVYNIICIWIIIHLFRECRWYSVWKHTIFIHFSYLKTSIISSAISWLPCDTIFTTSITINNILSFNSKLLKSRVKVRYHIYFIMYRVSSNAVIELMISFWIISEGSRFFIDIVNIKVAIDRSVKRFTWHCTHINSDTIKNLSNHLSSRKGMRRKDKIRSFSICIKRQFIRWNNITYNSFTTLSSYKFVTFLNFSNSFKFNFDTNIIMFIIIVNNIFYFGFFKLSIYFTSINIFIRLWVIFFFCYKNIVIIHLSTFLNNTIL